MLYFGTSLDTHGHYIWELTGGFYKSRMLYSKIPFDPYEHAEHPKGECVFAQKEKYTALHIAGSCKDERLGTVSVFWLNGSYDLPEFISLLKSNPAAMQIINAMPFNVDALDHFPNKTQHA